MQEPIPENTYIRIILNMFRHAISAASRQVTLQVVDLKYDIMEPSYTPNLTDNTQCFHKSEEFGYTLEAN